MRAIIPVAGKGTRLRPHTFVQPKVLLNVGGKPILGHIIEKALDSGIDDIAFIIGYKGELIQEYVESTYSLNCSFYKQEEMLGLAYAVSLADDYLNDEPVFIILGDTIFDANLRSLLEGKTSCLGVKEVEDPRRFGTVELDKKGIITKLVEKPQNPKSNLALVGLYYMNNGKKLKEAIEWILDKKLTTKDEYQITDALQKMIENGEIINTVNIEGWYDCGKPETILSTNRFLLSKVEKFHDPENTLIKRPVYIDPTAKIENSIIGPNTTIAAGAEISNSILSNSIVGEYSHVRDISLTDSIIGSRAVVKASAKSVNISDHSDVSL